MRLSRTAIKRMYISGHQHYSRLALRGVHMPADKYQGRHATCYCRHRQKVQLQPYQNSISMIDGVGCQRHAPADLHQVERQGIHRIRGLVGLTACLNGCGKELRPCTHWGSDPKSSNQERVAIPSKLSWPLYVHTLQNVSSYLRISLLKNKIYNKNSILYVE